MDEIVSVAQNETCWRDAVRKAGGHIHSDNEYIEVLYRWENEPEDAARTTFVCIGDYREGCEKCDAIDTQVFYYFEDRAEYEAALNKPYGDGFIISPLK